MGTAKLRVLAIDIGTSSVKGGIVDSAGKLHEWGREGLLSGGRGELHTWDPSTWDQAVSRLVSRFRTRGTVDAVAVSGNGPSLVPLDANGRPTASALLWLDDREVRKPEYPSFFLPKVAWFREHNPVAYDRTVVYLPCPEYLAYRLTGTQVAISPNRAFIQYLWDGDQIAGYGLDTESFPTIVHTGEKVGYVRDEWTDMCGLPGGVPVYAAGSDFLMSLVGTATVVPGRTCDRAGTSEGINFCSDRPVKSESLRTLPHVVEGRYNVAGILESTGRVFEWFRRISGQEQTSYDRMLSDIDSLPHEAGRPFFLPSLHEGPTWQFSGAAFLCLEPDHGPAEMGRAVVESIGFSIRSIIETLAENGCVVDELRVSGGQARNAVWNQMKSDATGVRIAIPAIVDAELLGNTICVLNGMGEFESLEAACEELVRIRAVYEPRPAEHRRFSESYAAYREARAALSALAGRLLPKQSK